MAKQRLSMRKIKQILRLKYQINLSNREIARSVSISPSSVATYLNLAKSAGLVWNETLTESEVYEKIHYHQKIRQGRPEKAIPDFAYIHREMKKKGVTLMLLWNEYREINPNGLAYSQFSVRYRNWSKKLNLSMRQSHKAGHKGFIDYSGTKIPITDPRTGKVQEADIFVFVLGASGYTYAEASHSQQLKDWIKSHINAFEFFGGTPEILVPDNLKSGVTKANRYEPDINPTYHEMAQHYRCAIIPARVRKPKDKAKAEGGVLLVQRWILASLRNRTFYSIKEANQAIKILLEKLNNKPLQKLKTSRRKLFEQIDQPALKALPAFPYQMAIFKICRVNIDYHIEVDRHYYSVPYSVVGQKVQVRICNNFLEVFHKEKRIASHPYSYEAHRHSTNPEHMPKSHRKYAEWTPSRILHWGAQQGESVALFLTKLMNARTHPEQGFRSCLGVIRLAKPYGKHRLNLACQKALSLNTFSFKSVQNILKNNLENQAVSSNPNKSLPHHQNLRGNSYYGGNNQ